MTRRHFDTYALVLGAAVLLAAAVTRFHLLGAQSFWNDEGNTYIQTTRLFADIAVHAARDIHPPGYYWLLAFWRVIAGETEFALRSFSALASLMTVALTYAIGRRIGGLTAGLAASAFVTLNSFSIYYAQEARMYALLALWSAASMWALVEFLASFDHQAQNPDFDTPYRRIPRWTLALALFNAAGLWTHYAYPFIMLAQGAIFLGWLAEQRAKSFAWRTLALYAAANLLTIALYLPWLATALERVASWPNTGDSASFASALSTILGWFALGVTYIANDPSRIIIGLMLALFGLTFRRERDGSTVRWLLPFIWTVLPLALFLALGLYREANLKFLLPSQIGFALLMGRGIQVLWSLTLPLRPALVRAAPRLAAAAGAGGMLYALGVGLQPLYHNPEFQRADYRGIAQAIMAHEQAGDAVILDAPNQEEVFRYYYHGGASIYPLPPGLGGDDDQTRAAVRDIIAGYRRIFVVLWGETERDPDRIVERTLGSEAYEARSDWYGDVRLVRYSAPVELPIVHDSGARFGSAIVLQRFALSADRLRSGDVLQLRLEWRAEAPLEVRYKVFVQLLNSDGVLAAQRDSEPGGGLSPTTAWTPGTVINDNHALLIPDNLSPANYSLIIGLYNFNDSQQRLPVGSADYLSLSPMTILPP